MKYLIIIYVLGLVVLAGGCSPAAVPTPSGAPQASSVPQSAQVATSTPGQAISPATVPLATATAGQSAGPTAAPAATVAAQGGVTLQLTSTAFADGGTIPKKYTCDGSSTSPALKWSGAPANTASFALIVDDPDAPSGTFTHWVAFDIPANQAEIAQGAQTAGKAGQNSARRNGYTGPCPPSGSHHYVFKLFALDVASLGLSEGATKAQVTGAMQGHILAQGQLIGLYGR